ncbi:MAG: YggS family pyridoxal phosphate-dependent enzyme [Maricaulis sp.]|jgi:pyridoxal phosphate enzyme (YggS family)|uniref:YggS family pyridoxal phosphate-dependent enzyme n=1 Tax=Maricaulis sp. TaxID=1486257 RepID=UPI001B199541|nr:YggS family pyridoxal phosphate-dependent enzyme [Maricaulis sp.]MBO6729484.1 YggS family pyridoxal phosphate-dependent enzyme [Maricaulis sp.]MBO6846256.1 YggS family pyridoxal phosphate-dependent enzyme [Maricaulis sp.]MBO6875867.1 YggS family pyridoxal phosphate-dependent enzyme [Maricaulis sp.]
MSIAEDISQNRTAILNRIDEAAQAAGRSDDRPTLVAVSKRQDATRIDAALAAGQRVFGENRVQEAQQHWQGRREDVPDLVLRLIGPLQTNKAADAVALFDVIETVDREKLARKLADEMARQQRSPRLYIQINTGEETQKSGVLPADLPAFLNLCRGELDLQIEGLMCIPPVEEPAGLHFALLAKLARENGLNRLSMGMSSDYEIAVQLGASSVRVGTALFGARD